MVAKYFVAFVACLALTQAGIVRRDAPSALDEIKKHADDFQKTFKAHLDAVSNSKNAQEVNKALEDGSNTILKGLSDFSNTLQSAFSDANGKAKEAFEQTRATFEQAAQDLRRQHPEVENQANQLRDKIQNTVHTTVEQSKVLAEEISKHVDQANQELAPKVKSAYDAFTKQLAEVQKKIQEAANKQ